MIRFLLGIIVTLLLVFGIYFFWSRSEEKEKTEIHSSMIQEQIKNVGKLVVVEGHFSQVVDYKNTRQNFFRIFPANKKAIVIVNAKVTIGYDLRNLHTEIDTENRTVTLSRIPNEEVNIYPEIEYYDITQDYFNQFQAEDYNKIKSSVHRMIEDQVNKSDLKYRARENLVSELQKIYILTNSMGWTLVYNDRPVDSNEMLLDIKLR
jgi:hypothetical protein